MKPWAQVAALALAWWAARVVCAAFGADANAPALPLLFAAGIAALGIRSRGESDAVQALDAPRALLLLAGVLSIGDVYQRIGSDGIEHYAMARSLLFDRDLMLENDVEALGLGVVFRTEEGRVIARGPFGQSLVWMPFVAAAHALTLVASALGAPVAPDGYSPPYHVAVTTASYMLGFAGLVLMDGLMRRILAPRAALVASLALFYATPLHFYLVSNPSLSHATQTFLMAAFVVAWRRARTAGSDRAWAVAGVFGGLVGLVRAQDFLLLIPVGADALLRDQGFRRLLRLGAGVVAGGLVQLAVWRELFGPDFVRVMMRFNNYAPGDPEVLNLLFSARHGALSSTPLYVIAVLGLVLALRAEPRFTAIAWAIASMSVVANAQFADWWASDSFGHRRLLGLLPFLAIGLAHGFSWLLSRPLVPIGAVVMALALWTGNSEYLHNAEVVARKADPVAFEDVARAQLDLGRRSLESWDGRLPPRVFELLWENYAGGFLDDPGELFELGAEEPGRGSLRGRWSAVAREGETAYRTVEGRRADLAAPLRGPGAMELTLRLRGRPSTAAPVALEVSFQGASIGSVQAPAEWTRVAITAPRELARRGFNLIRLSAPEGSTVDVDWIRVQRRP